MRDRFDVVSAAQDIALLPPPLEDGLLNLFAWQEEAFEAWAESGHCGIVEAVTGAGKTRLGLAAISEALRQGRQALLLVPTIELLNQWFKETRELLPWAEVGRLGDQHRDNFGTHQFLIATIQSALAVMQSGEVNSLLGHQSRLLVADEVHRLAGEQFSTVLDESFAWRLGLSATYERPDDNHLVYLDPYFGGVVYRLWYERAQKDNLIAPFDIALVGVELDPLDFGKYEELTDEIGRTHHSLMGYAKNQELEGKRFFPTITTWAQEEAPEARAALARKYMRAVAERLDILSQTRAKIDGLRSLTPALRDANNSLLFSLTKKGAEEAALAVSDEGIQATAVFSGLTSAERKQRMSDFRGGDLPVLAAPRVLDEGVDVPAAELAFVLAGNRTKRQLVQRLGRVIRRKQDGRAGKLVFFYAKNTIEDPEVGGDIHLNEVLPFARELGWFDLPVERTEVLKFLQNPPSTMPPAAPIRGRSPKFVPEWSAPEGSLLGDTDRVPASIAKRVPPAGQGTNRQSGIDGGHGPRRAQGASAGKVAASPIEVASPTRWDGESRGAMYSRPISYNGDALKMYLHAIGRARLLGAEEEVRLAKAIEAGLFASQRLTDGNYQLRRERRELEMLVAEGQKSHAQFIASNLRLVVSLAKKSIANAGTNELLDLIQEGNLGLERALQMWDYSQGVKFSTYASWGIRQAISRGNSDSSRTIRLPVHKDEELKQAKGLIADAQRRGMSEIEAFESTRRELGVSAQEIQQLLALDRRPLDLDQTRFDFSNGSVELSALAELITDDFAEDMDASLVRADASKALEEAFYRLDERSEQIIRMRYGVFSSVFLVGEGDPMTLDAIGAYFGLTRERIRQLEVQTLDKLREYFKGVNIADFVTG